MLEDLIEELATAYALVNFVLIERAYREFRLVGIEREEATALMLNAVRDNSQKLQASE